MPLLCCTVLSHQRTVFKRSKVYERNSIGTVIPIQMVWSLREHLHFGAECFAPTIEPSYLHLSTSLGGEPLIVSASSYQSSAQARGHDLWVASDGLSKSAYSFNTYSSLDLEVWGPKSGFDAAHIRLETIMGTREDRYACNDRSKSSLRRASRRNLPEQL
jgi:hypothetical protein